MVRISMIVAVFALLVFVPQSWASKSIQEERHELMETAKDAAKVVGGMLKGNAAFNAQQAMEGFLVWQNVAETAGDMFPEGSETGYDTEAKATVWTDREGFNKEMDAFLLAVNKAIVADPQSLDELNAAAGPVFKSCKSCHEGYRVEEED
jgi:cytochrome c556